MRTAQEILTEELEKEKAELTENLIEAGHTFSRHMRNCWTGERTASSVNASYFSGKAKYLLIISQLKGKALVDYSNTADLNEFYAGAADQYSWDRERWEKEIKDRI